MHSTPTEAAPGEAPEPASAKPATVPDLSRELEGYAYGGQYYYDATFEFVAHAVSAEGPYLFSLNDTSGHPIQSLRLDKGEATQLMIALETAEQKALLPKVPGLDLTQTIVWRMGNHNAVFPGDYADVTNTDEVLEWLKYALSVYEPYDGEEWDG